MQQYCIIEFDSKCTKIAGSVREKRASELARHHDTETPPLGSVKSYRTPSAL